MLPRLVELLLFGVLPFLAGSFATSAVDIADDETIVAEVRAIEEFEAGTEQVSVAPPVETPQKPA